MTLNVLQVLFVMKHLFQCYVPESAKKNGLTYKGFYEGCGALFLHGLVPVMYVHLCVGLKNVFGVTYP